ncbi:MAG: ACT domain-containing protein [Mogibacterium sp.]|nr:ACT domain-containing protein [Mogibacterium sp.]
METKETAIITVIGRDTVGILAKVAAAAAQANANIVQVSQIVMSGIFTMNMQIEVDGMSCSIPQLEEKIKAELPGYDIHVMHENIFSSMHTI